MPRRREAEIEDIEEETNPSQKTAIDEVEDADEQSRRSFKKVKREKTKVTASADPAPAANDAEDAEDGKIDVKNFKDQPLTRDNATVLRGLMMDWQQLLDKTHTNSEPLILETANSLADYLQDEDVAEKREEALNALDDTLRQIIDLESDLKARESSLDELYQKVIQGEEISDALDRYTNAVEAKMEENDKKTSRQKYMKNDQYIKFKQEVFIALNEEGKGIPPMTEFIPKEDGDVSDDEDLEMGGVAIDLKDPITLTYFEKPVTSTICGHTFSEKSIKDYCGKSTTKNCPMAGCKKTISPSVCKPNKDVERRVQQVIKRQKRAEEERDDIEEID